MSRDAPAAQKKFKEAHGLPFPRLSDPDHAIHEAYGAWGEKTMYGKKVTSALRTTVVVGADGKVEKIFPNVKVDGHAKALLDFVAG